MHADLCRKLARAGQSPYWEPGKGALFNETIMEDCLEKYYYEKLSPWVKEFIDKCILSDEIRVKEYNNEGTTFLSEEDIKAIFEKVENDFKQKKLSGS
jgi:hypothetical protein